MADRNNFLEQLSEELFTIASRRFTENNIDGELEGTSFKVTEKVKKNDNAAANDRAEGEVREEIITNRSKCRRLPNGQWECPVG